MKPPGQRAHDPSVVTPYEKGRALRPGLSKSEGDVVFLLAEVAGVGGRGSLWGAGARWLGVFLAAAGAM
jgi:hypothetical protein